MNGLEQLLPFVLIAVVFWFLLIRPQRRRQMALASTQRGIDVGDEVLLGAGIVGVVADVEEEYLHLEISPGVLMKVARQAVVRNLTAQRAADPSPGDGPDRAVEGDQRDGGSHEAGSPEPGPRREGPDEDGPPPSREGA